jgi:hypothetical protein
MKRLFLTALTLLTLAYSGCISAAVARASARGREVLRSGSAKGTISAHFGSPETTLPDWVKQKADAQLSAGESWTVWKIKGKPAQVDDGGGQATVSALTLGAGEVVLLPMTLLGAGSDALKSYYLVGIFGPDAMLRRHIGLEAK